MKTLPAARRNTHRIERALGDVQAIRRGRIAPRIANRVNTLRGTGPMAVNAAKTACIHGHEFDEANTRIAPRGYRSCRACARFLTRQRYWRRRGVEITRETS